jgi:D-alanyl-lipoteichoic acid acyltransferase DltB (MBOAT superfamily)
MSLVIPAALLLAFILVGRIIVRQLDGAWRHSAFAVLNVAGLYWFFFPGHNFRFMIYAGLIVLQFLMLRLCAEKSGWLPWLAFFTPIAALVMIRYAPGLYNSGAGRLWGGHPFQKAFDLVGLSYLAFRCSRLVLEVRNGLVKKPGFCEYVSFCFFLPTMPVGPINSYANFHRAFGETPLDIPAGRSVMRILVGFLKFEFLGTLCNQLTYSGLFQDDHPHTWVHLAAAVLFYYLYLYCNFSGFCDMAIGAAGLIGIPVPENFDNPFLARNVKDFWNRWHITLSVWMRDTVFSPLSKFLVRVMGPSLANHAVALTITVVFLLVGIWHGVGWNFAAYGAVHAVGVVTNHYYTIFLKKRLGRDGFKAYNENPWIRAAAIAVTFCYCGASLLFFANSFPQIREIFASLR